MGVHNFAINTGEVSSDAFRSVWQSNRTESEQRHTPLAIHDNSSADIKMARRLADEMINVSGAEVKIFRRTDNADYDRTWDEDADPSYWPAEYLKGYFAPRPLEVVLIDFGVDNPNQTEIIFSHLQIIEKFDNRMLRAGDVIQLPYNDASMKIENFRVLNAAPSGNFRYVWLYFTCQVEVLTADITVRVQEDIQGNADLDSGGVFREMI